MYMSAPASTRTANPPIAMPAIAPVESAGFDAAVVAAGEDDAMAVGVDAAPVDRVGETSAGKYSKGLNSTVAFSA